MSRYGASSHTLMLWSHTPTPMFPLRTHSKNVPLSLTRPYAWKTTVLFHFSLEQTMFSILCDANLHPSFACVFGANSLPHRVVRGHTIPPLQHVALVREVDRSPARPPARLWHMHRVHLDQNVAGPDYRVTRADTDSTPVDRVATQGNRRCQWAVV